MTVRKNFINNNLLNIKKNINNIVRKNIINLKPYQSARSLYNNNNNNDSILLNANESPIISLFSLNKKIFNKYPEPQSQELINFYSKYINLNSKNILITRGADEGIDIIMRTFCDPKKEKILFCPPTYDMYRVNAEILNIKYIMINSLDNWELNINLIKENLYNVKIIFICHPNNPTGNCLDKKNIIKLLKLVYYNIIVVIDEAYIEFCINKTLINLINKYNNLIIIRTLSKAFGLAGLRCGFILTNKKIINILQKVIAPYPIPDPVIDIAKQALYPKNLIIMKKNVEIIIDNKKWLINNLKKCKIIKKIFYSETNFILIKFYNSNYIFKELYKNKIIVRNQNHEKRLNNCLRITIGTFYECKKLLFELKKLSH
ncbi:histidinol-phosphate transaminase [Enterobacteriaceae endosymbiont of Donacia semicuprea]|uniref:histidinol-phosphate transaminase n=1 Tax=Enterobacteriaceae endosymbiont of Donacia semicuprea TaxID=2675783 RepID=UPI001FEBF95B|nr:histidinol-phosphate transaminase [Enterobacteriaceae endosymbiont of Donacia semicuprea]